MSLLHMAQRASDALNRVVIMVCIGCVLVMLGISFTGFTYQVVTGSALSWTYSLARLFLPWIGLLSITIAFRSGEHVAMTVLVRLLPEPLVRVAAYGSICVIAIFALMMVWYGWDFFTGATQIYMVSDRIQISHRFTAAAVPLTGLIMLLHLSHGTALLEHYTGEEEIVSQAIAGSTPEDRP